MTLHRNGIVLWVALFLTSFLVVNVTPSFGAIRLPWGRGRRSINHDYIRQPLPNLPTVSQIRRSGRWPKHNAYLKDVIAHVDLNPPEALTPVLQEFKTFIESTPRVYMYFVQMFDEIPWKSPYWRDLNSEPQIRDYHHLLQALNHITRTAPGVDLEFPPIASILTHPMATPSGHAAFLDPDVNKMLKKVLNDWGKFLQTPASRYALGTDDSGWLGEKAMAKLEDVANAPYNTSAKFEDIFACNPSEKYHGFSSWDNFFTRMFRDDTRPIASPDDDNIIVNACESIAYNIQTGVKLKDMFFIKGEPYSVLDMLGQDALAMHFAGGTVYQAFLSLFSYHRWHAPVSGIVRRAFIIDGTYYSEPLEDSNVTGIKPLGIGKSQAYLTSMATRAVVIIEADNPSIGLLAFIAVGMEEVSSCEITVREGQHIKKGELMGMFHFGGSSYCLLFEDGVKVEEFPAMGDFSSANVPIRSKLAAVTP